MVRITQKHLYQAFSTFVLVGVTALLGLALGSHARVYAQNVESSAPERVALQWGYRGSVGPDYWGDLTPEYSQCARGAQQSPIDFGRAQTIDANLDELAFHYQSAPIDTMNTGRSLQVNYPPGSTLTLDGQFFDLEQFHFHDPSEHTVDGLASVMEAHLVHKNHVTGDLAVVAVFMELGKPNSVLQTIYEATPREVGSEIASDRLTLNAADLLPANTREFYRYFGSLTTPPCSEIVNWIVIKEPIQVSARQVDHFVALVGENARPTQAKRHRFVLD